MLSRGYSCQPTPAVQLRPRQRPQPGAAIQSLYTPVPLLTPASGALPSSIDGLSSHLRGLTAGSGQEPE